MFPISFVIFSNYITDRLDNHFHFSFYFCLIINFLSYFLTSFIFYYLSYKQYVEKKSFNSAM